MNRRKRRMTGAARWLSRSYLYCRYVVALGLMAVSMATQLAAAPQAPRATAPARSTAVSPDQRQRIQQALPTEPVAAPREPRKLLIFDLNVGYGGHPSIEHANLAFTEMGKRTGAFETVVSRDPSVFGSDSLHQFDAVLLNNTVGNLFTDPQRRQNLVEFVYGGGGLLGLHGASVAFTHWPGAVEDWPEFGIMLGARGANHRDSDERVFIRIEEPDHPLSRALASEGFEFRDEFFRVHEPYSRMRVRVLLSIDTAKTGTQQGAARGDCDREDNDYALAWIRAYGRGRVFYSTIAHNPYVFWDPRILNFYLAAVQFALGDLPASATPSGRWTPAIQAQEKLGWRLGIAPEVSEPDTLWATIDTAAGWGLTSAGACDRQQVSADIRRPFDAELSAHQRQQVRLKLDSAGVRLLTYSVEAMPVDEAGCRRLFQFVRTMGMETIVCDPPRQMLDVLERLCDENDVNLAIDGRDAPDGWDLDRVLAVCQGRSRRVGACGDLARWAKSGRDPREVVGQLKERLITLQVANSKRPSAGATSDQNDRGDQNDLAVLSELGRLGIRPTMIGVRCRAPSGQSGAGIARWAERLREMAVQLAK